MRTLWALETNFPDGSPSHLLVVFFFGSVSSYFIIKLYFQQIKNSLLFSWSECLFCFLSCLSLLSNITLQYSLVCFVDLCLWNKHTQCIRNLPCSFLSLIRLQAITTRYVNYKRVDNDFSNDDNTRRMKKMKNIRLII